MNCLALAERCLAELTKCSNLPISLEQKARLPLAIDGLACPITKQRAVCMYRRDKGG